MWIKVDLFVVKLFTFISSRGPVYTHTHTHSYPLNAFYGYFHHFHYNLFAFIKNNDHEITIIDCCSCFVYQIFMWVGIIGPYYARYEHPVGCLTLFMVLFNNVIFKKTLIPKVGLQ